MKVCHCCQVAPNRCGLYGTTRDLIKSEILAGIDAGLLDAGVSTGETVVNGTIEGYPLIADEKLIPKDMEWAKDADCYFRHSFIPTRFQNLGKPLVMAMHGRPESSFRLESAGQIPVISTFTKKAQQDKRYKAFITFWPEYMLHWSTIIPKEKLFYVPAPVDLDYYKPFGEPLQFGKDSGKPNILVCDIWRDDVIPFNVIFAALRFQQIYCKTAKIHILALQGRELNTIMPMLVGMKNCGALGTISGQMKAINKYYAAADIVVTPHTIATRTVREPLSCGVPVVAGLGNRYTPYTANPMDSDGFAKAINDCWEDMKSDENAVRKGARQIAEKYFNPERTGTIMREVLEKICA